MVIFDRFHLSTFEIIGLFNLTERTFDIVFFLHQSYGDQLRHKINFTSSCLRVFFWVLKVFREVHLVLCPFELSEYLGDVALVLFVSKVVLFSQIISSAVPEMSLDGIEDRPGIIDWSRMTIPIQNISLLLEDLLADFERLRWLFAVDLEHLLTSVRVIGHLPLLRVFSEVFHEDHFLLVF